MKSLDKITSEETVNMVADKILISVRDKIKDHLADAFYRETETYLYEHYVNHKIKIEKQLIAEITEEFVDNPSSYKYQKLREKLFLENKELLTSALTDDMILKNVENIIWQHVDSKYYFNWRWKEAIVQLIVDNFDKFQNDELIQSGLMRKIEQLKTQNNQLQVKLAEITNVIQSNENTP